MFMSYLNAASIACSHHYTSCSCPCVVQEFQKGLEDLIHGKKPMSSTAADLGHLKSQYVRWLTCIADLH